MFIITIIVLFFRMCYPIEMPPKPTITTTTTRKPRTFDPSMNYWPNYFCAFEGVFTQEWEPYFTILPCRAPTSCVPARILKKSPTIGKKLG